MHKTKMIGASIVNGRRRTQKGGDEGNVDQQREQVGGIKTGDQPHRYVARFLRSFRTFISGRMNKMMAITMIVPEIGRSKKIITSPWDPIRD